MNELNKEQCSTHPPFLRRRFTTHVLMTYKTATNKLNNVGANTQSSLTPVTMSTLSEVDPKSCRFAFIPIWKHCIHINIQKQTIREI